MKRAVCVIGGTAKLGIILSKALSDLNFDLFITYNNSLSKAEDMQKNTGCIIHRLDLRNVGDCKSTIDLVFKQLPHCDVMINLASIFRRSPFVDTSWEYMEENMRIHAIAPIELTRHFFKICPSGHVINILDYYAQRSKSTNFFPYLVSKKTLVAATEFMQGYHITNLFPKPMITEPETASWFESLTMDKRECPHELVKDVISAIASGAPGRT